MPTLFSLIAEPLTGLVDTAFVSTLGASSLAALGVGTILLSAVFWVFNFLSIGTQTEVAYTYGRQEDERRLELIGMALAMAAVFGTLIIFVGLPLVPIGVQAMGASGLMYFESITYVRIRLLGAPAVLFYLVAFGAMRGLQDMRTPLWIALGVNALNIVFDAIFIFGWGPLPALGIAGAAWASVVSQWVGAIAALLILYKAMGFPDRLVMGDVSRFLTIGGDLFVRTGLLTVFLVLATRAATKMGPESGAAHQAIRQFWTFSALLLDAFAVTGQSLVGYFIGLKDHAQVMRVARLVCLWSLAVGFVIMMSMWLGTSLVIDLLVPTSAVTVFVSAWFVSALFQPLNALSFATDGLHWGTGDFRYLRNAVIVASTIGALALAFVNTEQAEMLHVVWWITGLWITIRAVFGVIRIWPGIGQSPFSISQLPSTT